MTTNKIISTREWVRHAYRYLREGEYVVTRHGESAFVVTIKRYSEGVRAGDVVTGKEGSNFSFRRDFRPISKEYSVR